MAARTIEARLVISGEDKGASASVAAVVKSVRQLEEVSKVSAPLQKLAKDFQHVEQASKAVDAAMKARSGLASAEAGLKATQGAAEAAAKALDQARVARAAFDGVKAARGSEQAKQIEAATKAVRDYTAAQRKAEGDVRKATAAVAAQASSLQHAEVAAKGLGADLGNLEAHQQRLRTSTEGATEAMRRQIRVEDQAAKAAAHHAKEEVEFARHRRMHGLVGAGAAVASGAVGIHGVGHIIAHGAQAGAEVQTERVRLEAINVPAAERQHIETRSLALAAQYKNVTQASVMELWKEMRSVMTDPHEVDHVIDPMVRAKSILDAQDKTGTASHGLNLLVKGAESIGAAKDPERFTHLLDGYIKAMQVMGKTITPEGIYEMQKYSKSAGARWSDRFILTTAQSLGQEMGGSTAGNSIQMAQKQIVGGMQNLHSKAKEFARVGLIDPKNLDYLKTGEVKGTKAGVKHAVKGDDLAATDFDQWVYTVLLPALEAKGIKKEGDQLAWVQKNFTGTGADVVSKIIQQRESFEAHAKMYGNASGLEGQAHNKDDATAALGGVSKSLETFLGVVTSPVMKDAANVLDSIAGGIGAFSVRLDAFNKAHPDLAKVEGAAAAGAGVAGAGLASALIYKALSSGFGLSGSAAALNTSAAALDAAAIKLGGGKIPEVVKDAAVATTAGAGATLGLGGIIIAGGAVAGAALDWNMGGNPGALGALTGQESDAQKMARRAEAMEAERKKGALYGERASLQESLAIVRERRDEFAKPDDPDFLTKGLDALGYGSPEMRQKRNDAFKAQYEAEIAQIEARIAEIDAKIKAAAAMPLPPVRPPDLSQVEAKATETGQKAGQSIANGVKDKAPEVEQQGQTLYERLKAIFAQGILIPMSFSPGEGFGGGSSGGGIVKAAYHPDEGGAFGGVRRSSGGGGAIPGRNSFGGVDPLAGGTAVEPDGVSRSGGSRSWRNNNPGNIEYGPFARSMGATGTDGRFARFPNYGAGRKAQERLLFDSKGYRDKTLAGAVRRWAPASENNVPAYLRALGGDDPNKRMQDYSPAERSRIMDMMQRHEGWRPGTARGNAVPSPASGLTIPEAPEGGFGGAGRSGDLSSAADRMHAAADRFENASMHARVELVATGGVRARSMRTRSQGAMTADVGISMPGAREADDDWL